MAEYLSYVEDDSKPDFTHPLEITILSPVAAEAIREASINAINVCRRTVCGQEVHGDSRPNANGIPTKHFLFYDNDNGAYEEPSLFPPMAAVPERIGAFQDITEFGGQLPRTDIIEISPNGLELDLTRTRGAHRPATHYHYHRHDLKAA